MFLNFKICMYLKWNILHWIKSSLTHIYIFFNLLITNSIFNIYLNICYFNFMCIFTIHQRKIINHLSLLPVQTFFYLEQCLYGKQNGVAGRIKFSFLKNAMHYILIWELVLFNFRWHVYLPGFRQGRYPESVWTKR